VAVATAGGRGEMLGVRERVGDEEGGGVGEGELKQ